MFFTSKSIKGVKSVCFLRDIFLTNSFSAELNHRFSQQISATPSVHQTFFSSTGAQTCESFNQGAELTKDALRIIASAAPGPVAQSEVVKALTGRVRPPSSLAIGHYTGLAFPSGHATQAAAVWGMLAAIVAASVPAWRTKVLAWTGALVIVGLVGVSRIYLGAHWLTDVLGGWAGGALWLLVLLTTVRTVASLRTGRPADRMPA